MYPTEMEKNLIELRSLEVTGMYITISELLDKIEQFTKDSDPNSEIVITSYAYDGINIIERRLETDQEFTRRIEILKARALSVKLDAERTWKKQQAKFARARKN
jgi:hypothetical protein